MISSKPTLIFVHIFIAPIRLKDKSFNLRMFKFEVKTKRFGVKVHKQLQCNRMLCCILGLIDHYNFEGCLLNRVNKLQITTRDVQSTNIYHSTFCQFFNVTKRFYKVVTTNASVIFKLLFYSNLNRVLPESGVP